MNATITLGQIRDLHALHEQGVPHSELGRRFGLSQAVVDLLCHGAQRRPGRWQCRLPAVAEHRRVRDGPLMLASASPRCLRSLRRNS